MSGVSRGSPPPNRRAQLHLAHLEERTVPYASVSVSPLQHTAEGWPDDGKVRFSRTGSTSSALTVNVGTSGTAISGTDYTGLGSTVTIPAGASYVDVSISAVDESLPELYEEATIQVQYGTGYFPSGNAATVGIRDNDITMNVILGAYPAAVKYTLPWGSVDETLATQTLTMSGVEINVRVPAGSGLPSTGTVTGTPTAKFAYGDFVSASFSINFASPFPFTNLTVVDNDGSATRRDNSQVVDAPVAVEAPPALTLDFSTVAIPTSGTWTWRLVFYVGGQEKNAEIEITPTDTADSIRDKVKNVATAKGLTVETPSVAGKSLLTMYFPITKKLNKLVIRQDVIQTPAGPSIYLQTKGASDAEPGFDYGNGE